ncbi:helix-turn-helix transcriptional regulator [Kutzneria buriramensis]|uniref:Helix-turn-helix protein n=1 Tax=Kutzneria buriramensis TaxID=1045776 RepID=A0A3E0HKJ5_9PSEU|nr:helix-turn-helix transcriptional regulator [Kutzneria buriramensis]REH46860.1 helix-turn-helix protein [Kutzneria buriramensis]
MRENSEMAMRDALADFLRRRRDALSPQVVGLRIGQRRRTPGLRRDEVARLANMSTTYYERLEQGRGPQPSAAIVAGLARALQLDANERAYLYLLAGHAEPVAAAPDGAVDTSLLSVMEAVEAAASPAFVADDLATILAQNELHTMLFGPATNMPGWEGNLFWWWFVSHHGRRSMLNSPDQQEAIGRAYVAGLRVVVAERGYDATTVALVTDLHAASAEFSRMWHEHEVSNSTSLIVSMQDDRVGRLDFDHALTVDPRSRQRLHSLHAIPDTPTRQRLTTLWALDKFHSAENLAEVSALR